MAAEAAEASPRKKPAAVTGCDGDGHEDEVTEKAKSGKTLKKPVAVDDAETLDASASCDDPRAAPPAIE